jgi:hypothetical protein
VLIVAAGIPGYQPTVIIDNTRVEGNAKSIVSDKHGKVLLEGGAQKIESWGFGRRYTDSDPKGILMVGDFEAPDKDKSLLNGKEFKFFEKDKPNYSDIPSNQFINILEHGVKNDASYPNDNAKRINEILSHASIEAKIVVFPAGTYKVDDTIFIPPNTRIVGALWSQIMATGKRFSDPKKPKVFIK